MATAYQNLSSYDPTKVPSGLGKRVAIIVSEWNSNITNPLLEGAHNILTKYHVTEKDINISYVPGSFELIFAAKEAVKANKFDAVIVLGCVVRGDTPHFDYVCGGVTQGITQLNLDSDIPVIFGLLTTDTMQQSEDRAGGIHGNKGDECAVTALKMMDYKSMLK